MVRDSISLKFLTPHGIHRDNWRFFPKIVFLLFLAAILNFCVKRKNAFIPEMVQNRAISAKFLTLGISAESSGNLPQKVVSFRFWNFCVKSKTHLSQKPCIFQHSHFDKIINAHWDAFPFLLQSNTPV